MIERRNVGALAGLALVAGLILVFLKIASDVFAGETRALDETILRLLRNPADLHDPIGPYWVELMMKDLTSLGSTTVLTFVTIAAAGYCLVARRQAEALLILVAVGSGTLVSNLVKLAYQRPRPEIVAHSVDVHTFSFPSSHAMLSAVTYLTLAAMLAYFEPQMRRRIYIVAVAVLATVAIGASRVYLGVHYPTDVLAGWLLGLAWALLWWTAALELQRRGRLDAPER